MRDALPHASFIGFTGTPIEQTDANTRAVFGDYISVYDIQRAVEDGATVPIYYESRLAKLALDETERPKIDPEFEEATEGEEVERKEKLKTKWAQLEAIVGAERRLALVAKDIVEHFETRLEALEGKAMIVGMSRRICVELYEQIVRLRPQWQHADDERGTIKVVITGSASDPVDWQPHIRNKSRREALANRFRDAADPLKLVLVRDMWLTPNSRKARSSTGRAPRPWIFLACYLRRSGRCGSELRQLRLATGGGPRPAHPGRKDDRRPDVSRGNAASPGRPGYPPAGRPPGAGDRPCRVR
jgi:type I restriction enzyme R subunit